jgi:hypothetical protein
VVNEADEIEDGDLAIGVEVAEFGGERLGEGLRVEKSGEEEERKQAAPGSGHTPMARLDHLMDLPKSCVAEKGGGVNADRATCATCGSRHLSEPTQIARFNRSHQPGCFCRSRKKSWRLRLGFNPPWRVDFVPLCFSAQSAESELIVFKIRAASREIRLAGWRLRP